LKWGGACPPELLTIQAAQEFHVLPPDVEERMTPQWWALYRVYLEELQRG